MAIVNITVSKPSGNLVTAPNVAASTTGTTVVWTLDASVTGGFNTTKPFEWYPDCGPPAGTCTAATIGSNGRSLSMDFLASTDLNLAYKLFVKIGRASCRERVSSPV